MTDNDFDHFLSALNSTTDYNKPPSDSQSIGRSPAEHGRSSREHTSLQPRDLSTGSRTMSNSPLGFAPYPTSGARSLQSRGRPTSAAFQATADQTMTDSPIFPDNFNGQFDSPALYMGQTPSFLPFIPQDASSAGSLASGLDTTSVRYAKSSSSRTGDVRSGIFSPGPQQGVSPGGLQDLLKGIEKCSESRRTCMTSALRILQTLHISPSACLSLVGGTSTSSASRQPRKIDSVLSTNREVVRLMAEMLKCSCISSSQFQLVLSSICAKLIAWYRAIIRNTPANDPGVYTDAEGRTAAHPDGASNAATGVTDERVLHQPFTVGKYSFDACLETKIRAQVVCSELQQLETFVANFLGRIQREVSSPAVLGQNSGKRSQGSSSIDSPGLSSGVHARLTGFLYKQLRDAKAECTAIATRDV